MGALASTGQLIHRAKRGSATHFLRCMALGLVAVCPLSWAAEPSDAQIEQLTSTQGCPGYLEMQMQPVDGGFKSSDVAKTIVLELIGVDYFEKYPGSAPTIHKPAQTPQKGELFWVSIGVESDRIEAKFLICAYGLNKLVLAKVKRELALSVNRCRSFWKMPPNDALRAQAAYAYCE